MNSILPTDYSPKRQVWKSQVDDKFDKGKVRHDFFTIHNFMTEIFYMWLISMLEFWSTDYIWIDWMETISIHMYVWNKIVKNFSANLPWNVNLIFLHSIGFNPLHWIETSSSKTWFLCISFWIFSFYLIFLRNFTFLSVASSKFTVRLCKFSDSFQLSCTFFLPNID